MRGRVPIAIVAIVVLLVACAGAEVRSGTIVVAEPIAAPDEAGPIPTPPTTREVAEAVTDRAGDAAGGDPAATARPSPDPTPTPPPLPTATPSPTAPPSPTAASTAAVASVFDTLPTGSALPGDSACAAAVRADPLPETNPANGAANATPGGPPVLIDGAHGFRDDALADRITGDFTGTTEELIRWASCKWGFDEDLTRARVWTESSWHVDTRGDQTDDGATCALIGLSAPCFQSYGLLQVKGTVHEGTHPWSFQSSAWGLDYAMAWQRACYEGAFTWLDDQGYRAGDVTGCVGAWYSGEWYDDGARRYLADVEANLASRPWE